MPSLLVSNFLLNRSNASTDQNNSSTDDIDAELAKIAAAKEHPSVNIRSKTFVEDSDGKDHVPYRPPSFQDYSSDSAKALLAKFDHKGSLTPQATAVCKRQSEQRVRKTRSLEDIHKKSLDDKSDEHILENVCAFVEVRSKNENRSDVVTDQLIAMGASVVPRLASKCTHVVFKEGSLSTYNKAKKLGLHLVSVNWIEACKKAKNRVSEDLYPPMNQEKYDSPGLFPKLRKTKSLQPKSDEEFAKMIEAKTKRIMKKKLANESPVPGTPRQSPKVYWQSVWIELVQA